MNFTGIVFLVALVLSKILGGMTIEESTREKFLDAALGVSCGTLMGANITLPFVACLFHDVNTMTGLFIHIMPPMVSWDEF